MLCVVCAGLCLLFFEAVDEAEEAEGEAGEGGDVEEGQEAEDAYAVGDEQEHAALVALSERFRAHQLDEADEVDNPCGDGGDEAYDIEDGDDVEEGGYGVDDGADEDEGECRLSGGVELRGEAAFEDGDADEGGYGYDGADVVPVVPAELNVEVAVSHTDEHEHHDEGGDD